MNYITKGLNTRQRVYFDPLTMFFNASAKMHYFFALSAINATSADTAATIAAVSPTPVVIASTPQPPRIKTTTATASRIHAKTFTQVFLKNP